MKRYSFSKIQNILHQDFGVALMKSQSMEGNEEVYDIVTARGKVLKRGLSLDDVRVILTSYDYSEEE